jgi:hypothetical protein
MPIHFRNAESQRYYHEVRAEAEVRGLLDKFKKRMDYLEHYGCSAGKPDHARVILWKDFAPLSFSLIIEFKQPDGTYKFFMDGALVFHGQHDGHGSGGAPTFAVSVGPVDEDWSLHT